MIAPASPAASRPADSLDSMMEFRVDPDAQPGNVLPALAKLLINMARRRREQQQAAQVDAQSTEGGEQSPLTCNHPIKTARAPGRE